MNFKTFFEMKLQKRFEILLGTMEKSLSRSVQRIYSSSPPFLEERLLLRDLRLFGAAFFEDLLFDFLRRLADLRFGAALRRDARRRRLGAMAEVDLNSGEESAERKEG